MDVRFLQPLTKMSSHTADEVAQQPINLFVIRGITEFTSWCLWRHFCAGSLVSLVCKTRIVLVLGKKEIVEIQKNLSLP